MSKPDQGMYGKIEEAVRARYGVRCLIICIGSDNHHRCKYTVTASVLVDRTWKDVHIKVYQDIKTYKQEVAGTTGLQDRLDSVGTEIGGLPLLAIPMVDHFRTTIIANRKSTQFGMIVLEGRYPEFEQAKNHPDREAVKEWLHRHQTTLANHTEIAPVVQIDTRGVNVERVCSNGIDYLMVFDVEMKEPATVEDDHIVVDMREPATENDHIEVNMEEPATEKRIVF